MSDEVGLGASLGVDASGVKSGTDQAITSLQAVQAEMVKTHAALSKETDTGNIDRLQQKIVALGSNIERLSKGTIKAADIIPPEVTSNIEQQTNAINTATKSVGSSVQGLSSSLNRSFHGLADLFIAPGRAALIFATQIPNVINRFRELSAEQKELAAQGKPAATNMQLLTQAFDPLNVAIGLGVVLLIKFLPKLIELAANADGAKSSVEELQTAIGQDKQYSAAIANVSKLTEDIKLAKEGFISKSGVVKEYNETIGKTTGQVDSLDQAEKALIKNKDAYIQMMAQKAVASYAYQKAAEAAVKGQVEALKTTQDPTLGGFMEKLLGGLASGSQFNPAFQRQVDVLKKTGDNVDQFTKIANDAEAQAAKIAKAFNFNIFADNTTSTDKAAKHIKDVTDVLAELNKSFADTDAQVEAHTLHISDVAKKNLGEVQKAINDLIKMGIKPTDPIIQGLDTLQNHLKIDTSNKDVIDIKGPTIKLPIPKIDPNLKTGIQKQIEYENKIIDDAFNDWRKMSAQRQEINVEVEVGVITKLDAAKRSIQSDRQYIIKLLNELNDPAISEATRKSLQDALDRGYSQLNADSAKEKLEEINQIVSDFVKKISATGFIDIGEVIGTAIGNDKGLPDLFSSLKTEIGSQVENFGKQLIEWGTAIALAKSTFLENLLSSPWLAIGAGVALVTLGAAIKSSVEKGGTTSTPSTYTPSGPFSGGGGYGYSTPSPYSGSGASSSGGAVVGNASANIATNIAQSIGTIGITGDFKLDGTSLVAAVQRTQRLQSR